MIFINAFIIFNIVQNDPIYSISVLYYITHIVYCNYSGTYKTQVRQQNYNKITVTCLWSLKHLCTLHWLSAYCSEKQHYYCK